MAGWQSALLSSDSFKQNTREDTFIAIENA